MNFKRIILISLILCFLSVACVSASETQTSMASSDVNDLNAIDGDINEYDNGFYEVTGENGSDGQDVVFGDLLSGSNSDDKLSASKEGTRNELNNLILAAKPGSTITLDKDYRFITGEKTVDITKNIVIN